MAELHRPTTELPPEIQLFHILPRLPAKSLGRFMCVSKQWHSILKSPLFTKIQLRHDHQIHHKLLFLSYTTLPTFHTIDIESPEDDLTVGRSLPFEATEGSTLHTITSFHGLVCLGVKKGRFDHLFSDLILWNPLTGEHKTLSKANSHEECYGCAGGAFGLYYRSCDDDYKLIRITFDHGAYVYSLKSDSWRKVDQTTCTTNVFHSIRFSEYFRRNIVVVNDKVYFLNRSDSIVRFDIKTEKFKEIATPYFIKPNGVFDLNLMVLKGCIHLYVVTEDLKTELWSMDGDENRDWTKLGSFSSNMELLHLMRNGNWLVFCEETSCLFELDTKMPIDKIRFFYDASKMHITSREKFIETLVSPNQYTSSND